MKIMKNAQKIRENTGKDVQKAQKRNKIPCITNSQLFNKMISYI